MRPRCNGKLSFLTFWIRTIQMRMKVSSSMLYIRNALQLVDDNKFQCASNRLFKSVLFVVVDDLLVTVPRKRMKKAFDSHRIVLQGCRLWAERLFLMWHYFNAVHVSLVLSFGMCLLHTADITDQQCVLICPLVFSLLCGFQIKKRTPDVATHGTYFYWEIRQYRVGTALVRRDDSRGIIHRLIDISIEISLRCGLWSWSIQFRIRRRIRNGFGRTESAGNSFPVRFGLVLFCQF